MCSANPKAAARDSVLNGRVGCQSEEIDPSSLQGDAHRPWPARGRRMVAGLRNVSDDMALPIAKALASSSGP